MSEDSTTVKFRVSGISGPAPCAMCRVEELVVYMHKMYVKEIGRGLHKACPNVLCRCCKQFSYFNFKKSSKHSKWFVPSLKCSRLEG